MKKELQEFRIAGVTDLKNRSCVPGLFSETPGKKDKAECFAYSADKHRGPLVLFFAQAAVRFLPFLTVPRLSWRAATKSMTLLFATLGGAGRRFWPLALASISF